MPKLDKIEVKGYKSIRDQTVELGDLNVLIGANGAGKSNFISIFKLLRQIVDERLQLFVGTSAGADQLLHYGSKVTQQIDLHFYFGQNQYRCELTPTGDDSLLFGSEVVYYLGPKFSSPYDIILGHGHKETLLREDSASNQRVRISDHVLNAFKGWQLYHFHDTSSTAKIKKTNNIDDNRCLQPDAGNLAAYLFLLRETKPDTYRNIVRTIRMVAPFFDDFALRPSPLNENSIKLEWRERRSRSNFGAHVLSDGTLRFMSLATLLMQPASELPSTILLDEPELGLHPYAIVILADLLAMASKKTQVVAATQSVTLVNHLNHEDIIVVDRPHGETTFRSLTDADVEDWLEDYTLGELWEKNVIGGRPRR